MASEGLSGLVAGYCDGIGYYTSHCIVQRGVAEHGIGFVLVLIGAILVLLAIGAALGIWDDKD